jgi:uncharacterized protein YjbI with pentapeptide repeats
MEKQNRSNLRKRDASMAKQEQIDILQQGVETWNRWRQEHPDVQPNLQKVYFRQADLRGINLQGARLNDSNLSVANLSDANLSDSQIYRSALLGTNLTGANLSRASLSGINFRDANLSRANLSEADLSAADFSWANFNEADLTGAEIGKTIFGYVDLSTVKGLETVKHRRPSIIGTEVLTLSGGTIPTAFLQKAGLSETFIAYARSLIGLPIDYYTCFISYSNLDQDFAQHLYTDLQCNGVRCWFAPEDLKIGDHYHQRIDESISLYDKLILILSEHAIQSAWVEREVVAAREKEDRQQRPVLFPLRLDDAMMDTTKAWAATLRRTCHIGDFTDWTNPLAYQVAFDRLLRDLKKTS